MSERLSSEVLEESRNLFGIGPLVRSKDSVDFVEEVVSDISWGSVYIERWFDNMETNRSGISLHQAGQNSVIPDTVSIFLDEVPLLVYALMRQYVDKFGVDQFYAEMQNLENA